MVRKTQKKLLVAIVAIAFVAVALGGASSLMTQKTPVVKARAAYASPATVDLGWAEGFVIFAETGVSTTSGTAVTGDIGVYSYPLSSITGFSETLDGSGTFATSAMVTGKIYAADMTSPTPETLLGAKSAMETAFTDAAGRAADATELYAGNIGGQIFTTGVYKWTSGVTIPTSITISGSSTDVFIFQIAGTLTVSSSVSITLSGALAKNIFWQVSGSVTLGTSCVFNGVILGQTLIALETGATLNGRALAQSAVTLQSNPVTEPNHVVIVIPEFGILMIPVIGIMGAAMIVVARRRRKET